MMHEPSLPAPPDLELRSAIVPLRLLFWCTLLLIISAVFILPICVLSDLVCLLVITCALGPLRRLDGDPAYRAAIGFARTITLISLPVVLLDKVDGLPPPIVFMRFLLGLLQLLAIIVFCRAMRGLSHVRRLDRAERAWGIATRWVTWAIVVPSICLWWAWLITGDELTIEITDFPTICLVVLLVLTAEILFLRALHVMRREIKERIDLV
jgi:hypothetical protein